MLTLYQFYQKPWWLVISLLIICLWDLVWRGLALWHSAKNKQKGWFIAVLLLNTLGLLPIIYLLWFKPKEKKERSVQFKIETVKKKSSKSEKKSAAKPQNKEKKKEA